MFQGNGVSYAVLAKSTDHVVILVDFPCQGCALPSVVSYTVI